MKRVVGIIAILVIAALAFVYPSIADNSNHNLVEDNVTAVELNDSDFNISEVEESKPEIKLADSYNDVEVKKSGDGIISKDDMKAFYENYYNNILVYDNASKPADVDVSELKTLSNGSKYYRITIKDDKQNIIYIFDALADIIPKNIPSQNPKIQGVFHSFYCDNNIGADQSILKIEDQILEKAQSKYEGHYKSTYNDVAHVYLDNINGNNYYMVEFDNKDLRLVYDEKYLYYDSYYDNEEYGENEYIEMSRNAAMEKLRSQNYPYMDKLSLDDGTRITEPGLYEYNFTVTYTDEDGSQNLGYIIVDAHTREIIEFNVHEPVTGDASDEANNDTANDTDVTIDEADMQDNVTDVEE